MPASRQRQNSRRHVLARRCENVCWYVCWYECFFLILPKLALDIESVAGVRSLSRANRGSTEGRHARRHSAAERFDRAPLFRSLDRLCAFLPCCYSISLRRPCLQLQLNRRSPVKYIMAFAVYALANCASFVASAQISYEGCKDIRGISVASIADYSLRDVAMASLASNGAPIIRYNPQILSWLHPQTRLFMYAHECGHHALGHTLGTAFPLIMEQQADCFAIQTLVKQRRVNDNDIAVIQGDIRRAGVADWTHLPGGQRAINLTRCLGANNAPVRPESNSQSQRLFCCDAYGNRRCMIAVNPGPLGSSCYCNGIPGVGTICQ